MKHRITVLDDFMLVETSGPASLDGFAAMNEGIVSHPQWAPRLNVMVDHSDLNQAPLSSHDVVDIASQRRLSGRDFQSKRAILCPDALGYGLARMWWSYLDEQRQQDCRIFRDRDEAEAWLLAMAPQS